MTEPSQSDTGQSAPARPGARERGRMRRRLREQRQVREALLLDLGALVFELHRHGRREPELLQAKASELSQVDAEVRGLSEALDADLGVVELVSAGIAGTCESCGGLLSADTRFCPACGAATKPGLEPKRGHAPPVPVERHVEAPTEEHDLWEEIAPEEEALGEESVLAEPESEPEPGPEPEPELEPAPEPQPDLPGEATIPVAPWLRSQEPAGPPEPEPEPEPVKVPRQMGSLERRLRGRRKDL